MNELVEILLSEKGKVYHTWSGRRDVFDLARGYDDGQYGELKSIET